MPKPKPALAAWISTERHRMDWSVEQLSERLESLGIEAKPATVRVWEAPAGRPPRQEAIEAMERLFGSTAPEAPTGDVLVAAAIDRQTVVLERLVETLERQQQADLDAVVARSVKAALQAAGVPAASSGQSRSDAPQPDPV